MRLVTVPLDDDLAPYSRHLWQLRIAHRVFEESGQQVLELAKPEDVHRAQADYEAWRSGALALPHPDELPQPSADRQQSSIFRQAPVVLLLIALAAVVFVVTGRGQVELTALFTIVDLLQASDTLSAALGRGEFWRPLTPILLHFSVPHILFNGAVIFEVGRRVEIIDGSARLLALVVLLGVISNLLQHFVGDNPKFGGLSGVAYGLVGFVLIRARLNPAEPIWQLPKGIALSLVIFLVVFSTGITEPFGLHVANGAHWGGLIAGMALAPLFVALLGERRPPPEFHS